MKMGEAGLEAVCENLVIGFHPEWVDPTAWIAPNAVVTGEVHLAEQASVWFGATLRGDSASIHVGPRTNIQDGSIIHVDHGMPTSIGADVVVGHGAIIHAATVEDGALIAIRATVLSQAVIGERSIIGSGAVVPEGRVIPPRSLVLGIPGRVIRLVTEEQSAAIRELAARYVAYSRSYLAHSRRE